MSDLKEIVKMQKPTDQQKIPLRTVSKVQFSPLTEEKTNQERGSFENLKVQLDIIYGSKTVTLKDLSKLTAGSLITLDEEAQMLVEIEANGKKIGRGEIVAVEGQFGVKIIEII